MLSKVLAERLKNVLPSIVKSDQTAYVKNRFLGESVRLISDILEVTKKLNIDGYVLTIDIEKAFDSVDHPFLYAALNKLGFDKEFIDWIKVLNNGQESCILNGGESTGYFKLERGSRQGDPISAYLFIIIMEIFFTMIRSNPNIEGLKILDFLYTLTSYADDTTFFLKNEKSALQVFATFSEFSNYSGLNVNRSKCEFAGIGVKRGVQTALPGVNNIDLMSAAIKILGVYFTYNSLIFREKNFFETIEKIENVLAVWRWRNLTLSGKITVFKSLAFSKLVFSSYLNFIPGLIIDKLNEIQKNFIWDGKTPKIKHSSLICDYDEGGLKDIDIKAKIASFHLCWLKRLYADNFHPWKNIPLKLIEKQYGYHIFFPNAQLKFSNHFPKFYHSIAENWSKIIQDPLTAETAASQQIWNNFHIKIDGQPARKNFSFQLHVIDFFENNKLLDWHAFKSKFQLKDSDFFKWLQLKKAIPKK